MRVEFNQNGFSATMGSDSRTFGSLPESWLNFSFFKKYACPFFGAFAAFLALALMPFGFLISILIDLLQQISHDIPNFYIWSLGTAWSVCAVCSVAFSIVSLVYYAKSNKVGINIAGLVFAIIALLLFFISIAAGITAALT